MITLYNTLAHTKQPLIPIIPGEISLYACGPTVYHEPHLGALRTIIFEDTLRRTIEGDGLKVKHAIPITDLSHKTLESTEMSDPEMSREVKKMLLLQTARTCEDAFFRDLKDLNILKPTSMSRATEHVGDMISFIQDLERTGTTYRAGGNVYFDTSRFPEYGKLSGKTDEKSTKANADMADDHKKNPADFVLWFTNSKFSSHIMEWDSPWGKGYPGWHIECSTIASKSLGNKIDIHCGGIDQIHPHHENEIAQSECRNSANWVNIWMHGAMLDTSGVKMTRRNDNVFRMPGLKERGFMPLSFRFFCLSTHYRSQLSFTFEKLAKAQQQYLSMVDTAADIISQTQETEGPTSLNAVGENKWQKFSEHMRNDLSTPQALQIVTETIKSKDISLGEKCGLLHRFEAHLGLDLTKAPEPILDDSVHQLAASRLEARRNKDWNKADQLRQQIEIHGYAVRDTGNTYRLVRKPRNPDVT